jgi:hypothetical protein
MGDGGTEKRGKAFVRYRLKRQADGLSKICHEENGRQIELYAY